MTDLPTRLRAYNPHDATARSLMDEAAAEIEGLRRLLEQATRLATALQTEGEQLRAELDALHRSWAHERDYMRAQYGQALRWARRWKEAARFERRTAEAGWQGTVAGIDAANDMLRRDMRVLRSALEAVVYFWGRDPQAFGDEASVTTLAGKFAAIAHRCQMALQRGEGKRRLDAPAIREALAEYAHLAWSGWMRYLFEKSRHEQGGYVVIPVWAVARWMRQMNTAYADLPEEEKESDRAEADKMLALLGRAAREVGDHE